MNTKISSKSWILIGFAAVMAVLIFLRWISLGGISSCSLLGLFSLGSYLGYWTGIGVLVLFWVFTALIILLLLATLAFLIVAIIQLLNKQSRLIGPGLLLPGVLALLAVVFLLTVGAIIGPYSLGLRITPTVVPYLVLVMSIVSLILYRKMPDDSAKEQNDGAPVRTCPGCGGSLPSAARHCPDCGIALSYCPECGAVISADTPFCQECGSKLN